MKYFLIASIAFICTCSTAKEIELQCTGPVTYFTSLFNQESTRDQTYGLTFDDEKKTIVYMDRRLSYGCFKESAGPKSTCDCQVLDKGFGCSSTATKANDIVYLDHHDFWVNRVTGMLLITNQANDSVDGKFVHTFERGSLQCTAYEGRKF